MYRSALRYANVLLLGSLFNHSETPNVTYSIDTKSETIRFFTTRSVEAGEELCFFYGHRLWFTPDGSSAMSPGTSDVRADAHLPGHGSDEDLWKRLRDIVDETIDEQDAEDVPRTNPFWDGNPEDVVPEDELPFFRTRVTPEDINEGDEECVRTSKWDRFMMFPGLLAYSFQ